MLFILSITPSILLMVFFYVRDKYEKEPKKMLLKAFIFGVLAIIPALILEVILTALGPQDTGVISTLYISFIVAGLTEELIKYVFLRNFILKSPEFNEMYDGIVYGVFLSLGFATTENILYVLQGGVSVAVLRLLTAVPAHALFGTVMGYYLGKARFYGISKSKLIFNGLLIPVVLHGIYDFIALSGIAYSILLLIPFMVYLWRRGLKNTRELIENSPFKKSA